MRRSAITCVLAVAFALAGVAPRAAQSPAKSAGGDSAMAAAGLAVLIPTAHPPLPRSLSDVWFAPARVPRSGQPVPAVTTAARLTADREFTRALAAAAQAASLSGPIGQYALYYTAVAQLGLGREADALKSFRALRSQKPVGYLSEAAAYGEAETLLAAGDTASAIAIYEQVLRDKPSYLEDALMRLGRAHKAAADHVKATEAFARVYYEFAMSELAPEAGAELTVHDHRQALTAGSQRYALELGRAERLFGARQYDEARGVFVRLLPLSSGDDEERIGLRIAESDFFLRRYRNARDGVQPFLERATRQAEALYFFAAASLELRDEASYMRSVSRLLNEFPTESWTGDALNSLGTYYVRRDEDDKADDTFRRLYLAFPKGPHAERAAWKAGWRAYRQRQYRDTIAFFERAAADFPRSDYRPSWLYWAGRAHEALNERPEAALRFELVIADYQNSYYGRKALTRLGSRPLPVRASGADSTGAVSAAPPNAGIIRELLGAGMYDEAHSELRYARRTWGESAAIQATIAWANQQQSRTESGTKRFELMRGAITTMRRAYPQFMAAGGEEVPRDVMTVIFPIAYWDLIKRYSAEYNLDPYFMAALVSQESTFVADIRSHANAYGLMQLMPATARQYARRLKLPYSSRLLTNPEANVRMGMLHFTDQMKVYGGKLHLVLASYNAGDRPVRQWLAERPGVDDDEFIDDIPYPETQGYVKRIMGTADDYRRLYGPTAGPMDGLDKTPFAHVKQAASVTPAPAAPVKKAPAARQAPKRKPAAAPAPATKSKKPASAQRR